MIDYFQYDSKFSQNEERYATIRHEILGSESEGEGGALFESESEDEAEGKELFTIFPFSLSSSFF